MKRRKPDQGKIVSSKMASARTLVAKLEMRIRKLDERERDLKSRPVGASFTNVFKKNALTTIAKQRADIEGQVAQLKNNLENMNRKKRILKS